MLLNTMPACMGQAEVDFAVKVRFLGLPKTSQNMGV